MRRHSAEKAAGVSEAHSIASCFRFSHTGGILEMPIKTSQGGYGGDDSLRPRRWVRDPIARGGKETLRELTGFKLKNSEPVGGRQCCLSFEGCGEVRISPNSSGHEVCVCVGQTLHQEAPLSGPMGILEEEVPPL